MKRVNGLLLGLGDRTATNHDSRDGEQAHDLAYAFHNLPKEIYGWGNWSVESMRARLQHYQSKHAKNLGVDYVKAFNAIFNSAA